MADKRIYTTDNDMRRLRGLIESSRESLKANEKYLKALEEELNSATVMKPQEIPPDVVTMNSEVHLRDMDTREETVYRIVFPHQADADKGYISIIAPIGTALLGYRVGDVIEWKVPAGIAKWKVVKITYQPEAAGDFDL
ncbi:MAG: nucleoside diphosphate kinase regulator [Chitinispirillaceae bacterium]|nr:nucleoside diphosphate kinase regulator [Chitinispirillaceae bacterium]